MKSIFNSSEQSELKERLSLLNANAQSEWGKMNVAQMCRHCALALDMNAGKIEEEKPNLMAKLLKPMIKKVVFGEKPYRKNSPTSPQFVVKDELDFNKEYENLVATFDYYTNAQNKEAIVAQPSKLFGQLSESEKGWAMYKHLDHHLQQFGV